MKDFLDEKMTENPLDETINIGQQIPQAAVIQEEQPQMTTMQQQPFQQQPFQQQPSYPTEEQTWIKQMLAWAKTNMKYIFAVIVIMIGFIILINILKKSKEPYSIESQNGILKQDIKNIPGKGAILTTQSGDNIYEQELSPGGVDMSSVLKNDISMTAIKSSKQAEISLQQQEGYMGMKQPDEPDTANNLQETSMMDMLKNQNHNIQIQQNRLIQNSAIMNSLDLIKQQNSQRQIPLQDVNELEQLNKTAQNERDSQYMIQAALGAGMQLAPPDPNEIIKNRVRYTVNSNRPTQGVYDQKIEPIAQSIEFKDKLDYIKESDIKTSGSQTVLPDMKPVEDKMPTTSITQEPIVQVDKEKIIIDQQLIQQDNNQNVVVEKTVNPEIIAKVEEQYSKWPSTLISKQQREAAGQFMTILVLMKHSGIQIPKFDVLVQTFPEIKNMKQQGMFKGFDKNIVRWANEQIDSVNRGEKSLDSIIGKFKAVYKITPVQTTMVGIQNSDGSITKQVDTVQPQITTNKEGFKQYAMNQNGKRKVVVKREKYNIKNGNVSNKKIEKYQVFI